MNEKIERAKSLLTEVRAEMNGPAFEDFEIQEAQYFINEALEEIERGEIAKADGSQPALLSTNAAGGALLSVLAKDGGDNQQAENWRGMINEAASLLYDAGPFGKDAPETDLEKARQLLINANNDIIETTERKPLPANAYCNGALETIDTAITEIEGEQCGKRNINPEYLQVLLNDAAKSLDDAQADAGGDDPDIARWQSETAEALNLLNNIPQ